MKHFVFLVAIFSFGYSFTFISQTAIRFGVCDKECNQMASNKTHQERKDFNREYFNKCVDACMNYQEYHNLK